MPPRVDVVGLGPGGPDLVTAGTFEVIASIPEERRLARTGRHPSAHVVGDRAATCDDLYESGETLEEVYRAIVERIVALAADGVPVLYAVPGSPVVAERTVELLLADARLDVVVHPALSFLDLAWARLGVDPVALAVRVVDGQRVAVEAAGERGPLLVAQCDSLDVLSEVKLAVGEALDLAAGATGATHDVEVVVLHHLGLPDERVQAVPWFELDRALEPDHLTSVWVPASSPPIGREVARLAELVATLRQQCPWDREQTHQSLTRHLLEEAYEVVDAIDHLDVVDGVGYEHLEEELGDLLFQVVFHATLATEAGRFTLADVARGIHDKLYARHPHVFGAVTADSAPQVAANWEQLKKAEKGRASVFDGIPDALPSLLFAVKVLKKADALVQGSTAGGQAGPLAMPEVPTIESVVARASIEPSDESIGSLLLAVVELCRGAGVDPETALRTATIRYRDAARTLEPDPASPSPSPPPPSPSPPPPPASPPHS